MERGMGEWGEGTVSGRGKVRMGGGRWGESGERKIMEYLGD